MKLLKKLIGNLSAIYRRNTYPKRPRFMYRYPQIETEERAWLKKSRKGRK